MTDKELMQQALDALEYVTQSVGGNAPESFDVWFQKTQVPAEALRARLAQPEPKIYNDIDEMFRDMGVPVTEQEPVAIDSGKIAPPKNWGELSREEIIKRELDIAKRIADAELYTAPPQREWQGLTDEEIDDEYFDNWSISRMRDFARAIEAKLKEKNT